MNASQMTFGVEIECLLPVAMASCTSRGGYHSPAANNWLPQGWRVGSDGSIRSEDGYFPVEIVSPVLSGEAGIRSVIEAVESIRARGGKVNFSCGLHVHVGFNYSNTPALAHLVAIVANYEKAIFATTGTRRREQQSWCKGLKRYGHRTRAQRQASQDRYHMLNLASRLPTVEFRAFAGTVNTDKIVGYISMCLGLVEKAHVRAAGSNTYAVWRRVEASGTTELARLMRYLGWSRRGGTGLFHGQRVERVMTILKAMAAKYDGEQG